MVSKLPMQAYHIKPGDTSSNSISINIFNDYDFQSDSVIDLLEPSHSMSITPHIHGLVALPNLAMPLCLFRAE